MKKIVALMIFMVSMAFGMKAQTGKASYPGGAEALQTYIATNLQYPADAKANGIEGVVSVLFVVKADGSIGNIKIKRMVDPDLESEAIRLVKNMPKWTPAPGGGDSQEELEIPFTLE